MLYRLRVRLVELGRAVELDYLFFFFNDTATTEIYTLSLHDALPISLGDVEAQADAFLSGLAGLPIVETRKDFLVEARYRAQRSEEHTSELQSQSNLVCRLLLEKKQRGTHLCWLRSH